MGLVLSVVATLLLLFQLLLIVRAVLDWTAAATGPASPGSVRGRVTGAVVRVTEPVLAPVRRVVPPLRLGGVALDLSFLVVFLAVLLLRQLILSI
jgi:YggT family protein